MPKRRAHDSIHPQDHLGRIRKRLGPQATHLELCEELLRRKERKSNTSFDDARKRRLLKSWLSMLRRKDVLEFVNRHFVSGSCAA